MRTLVFGFALFLAATQATSEPTRISFEQLPDPLAQNYEDPFRDLGYETLGALRTIAVVEPRLSSDDLSSEERTRITVKANDARAHLKEVGVDADSLLAQRWEVAERRERAMRATNPNFAGAEVVISGFVTRVNYSEGEAFGYLVPEMGMCSHMPPPPPNQLIRVNLPETFEADRLFLPVEVNGLLQPEQTDETLFFIDGPMRLDSEWSLEAEEVRIQGAAQAPHSSGPSAIARRFGIGRDTQ